MNNTEKHSASGGRTLHETPKYRRIRLTGGGILTAKILAAGCFLALAAAPMPSYASISWETDSAVAGAASVLGSFYGTSQNPEEQLAGVIAESEAFSVKAQASPREQTLVTSTESAYSNVAISHVSNYVNVRSGPNTESEIVGKIYNNCAATILATVDGEGGSWYQIQSGTVNGYIKAEYFITGAEAEKIAKQVGTMYAKITNADTLRLRAEPSLESATLTLLSEDAEYVALEETGDFVKIQVDSDLIGYVHKDYVQIRVEFKQAVSLAEEQAQLEEEARRKKEAEEAIAKLEEAKKEAAEQQTAAEPETEASSETEAETQQTEAETQPETSTEEIGTIARNPLDTAASQETESSKTETIPESQSSEAGTIPETAAPETVPGEEFGPGGAGPGAEHSGNSSGGTSSGVTTAARTAIVAYAKQFLGNPYVYGGTSLTNGADCSGFTMRVFEHFGIDIGRTSRDQAAKGKEIPVDSVQPGDLLFYESQNYINHVAIYIGGGQVIHSSTPATGITTAPANYRTPCKAVTFLD